MAPRDEDRARDVRIPSLLEWLPFLATLSSDPTVRSVGTTAGAMSLMAGNYRAFDNGERAPNQPDDFGNYYGANEKKLDAEMGRRMDEMTDRVIKAGWY
jgi:hypothetical protein